MEFFACPTCNVIVVSILICLARVADVTLGTLRIIFISKGMRIIASIAGFLEIFIWIIAISYVMQHLDCIYNYFTYALGFAIGVYIGMAIENKLAMGLVVIRIITHHDSTKLIKRLREENCGVTVMEAHGSSGYVHVILTVVKRSSLKKIIPLINECNPNAFYSVEDIRFVNEGIFPKRQRHLFVKRGIGSNGARKGK